MKAWFVDRLGRNMLEVIPNVNLSTDQNGNPLKPPFPLDPTPPVVPTPPTPPPTLPAPPPTGPVDPPPRIGGSRNSSRVAMSGWPWPFPPFGAPPGIPPWPPGSSTGSGSTSPPPPSPPPVPPIAGIPPNAGGPMEYTHAEQIPFNPYDPQQEMTLLPIMSKSPRAVQEAQWSLWALPPATRVRVAAVIPTAKDIVETTIHLWNTGRPDLRGTVSGIELTKQTSDGSLYEEDRDDP